MLTVPAGRVNPPSDAMARSCPASARRARCRHRFAASPYDTPTTPSAQISVSCPRFRCPPRSTIGLTSTNTEAPEMIIQSPYRDVEFAPVPLHDFVLDGAAGRGDRAALIDGPTGRVLTYAELAGTVRRAAAGLVARGVAKDDTLALCSANSPEFAVAYFAA